MYIELDKREFYFKKAKSNLAQSIKNFHKNIRAPHICFLYLARTKVKWDARDGVPTREN